MRRTNYAREQQHGDSSDWLSQDTLMEEILEVSNERISFSVLKLTSVG